jgi:precorrin-6B methylase 2
MKKLIKRLISILVSFSSVKTFFTYGMSLIKQHEEENFCKQISPDRTVIGGPFRGLKYASLKAAGSALLPKIIGSYEDELKPVMDQIFRETYERVIDVGCAEGYYAVGLATKMPATKLFAFDTDLHARRLCKEMASVNGVSERIEISGFCGPTELSNFVSDTRSLVICDTEGYENILFSEMTVAKLSKCDVLVELHDYFHEGKSKEIVTYFSNSHETTIVSSNFNKYVSDYLPQEKLKRIHLMDSDIAERPIRMCWLFARAITELKNVD